MYYLIPIAFSMLSGRFVKLADQSFSALIEVCPAILTPKQEVAKWK